jgi:hypothetical protein
MDGIRISNQHRFQFGRKLKFTEEQIVEMNRKREDGVLIMELGQEYGISNDRVYRLTRSV